ncbi:MAG: hypothetical protein ACYDAK_05315 [Candidatus Limnocylindrales bacterium]
MTIKATQGIASGYGTYAPGDLLDPDLPEPVRDAWLAAGIAVDQPESAAEKPVATKPKRAAPVERATVKAPETATSRRQPVAGTPGPRFVPDTSKDETPQRRLVANAAESPE